MSQVTYSYTWETYTILLKTIDLINVFNTGKEYKSTHKGQLCFYTLKMKNLKKKLRKQFHQNNIIKKNKILRSKFNQGSERLVH